MPLLLAGGACWAAGADEGVRALVVLPELPTGAGVDCVATGAEAGAGAAAGFAGVRALVVLPELAAAAGDGLGAAAAGAGVLDAEELSVVAALGLRVRVVLAGAASVEVAAGAVEAAAGASAASAVAFFDFRVDLVAVELS